MNKIEGSYNFNETESKFQKKWEESNIYKWDNSQDRDNNFVIDTPPPTVSGQLHMGHIFSYTQTDFIARFQRMNGKNVFYPMGFDDNGLPTERLVEKKMKVKASKLEKAEFVDMCKNIVHEEEEKFKDLFSSMSLSVDWNLKYQSISDDSSQISQMSFLDLAKKGQIYRKEQPILWDPVDGTALSQADIEDKEKDSEMHDISFKLEDGTQLVIATTRPELLPACVSVFFHPEDERYKKYEGQNIITPIFNQKVKLLADEDVNIEKGTGLVMCCTFGDSTDIMWRDRHNLDMKIIINKYGRIRDDFNFKDSDANEKFEQLKSLKVKEARSKMIEMLKESGDLKNSVAITHTVKCAERSGAPLEIIAAPQWFVKTIDHKHALLERSNELNWYPKSMKIKLDNWINSIAWDWCISRQRFFGVPFPVWYSKKEGEEGKVIFAKPEDLPVDPTKDLPKGYSREEVIPETDIMDTWATSSVSPQLSSSAINEEFSKDFNKHKKLFPFDLRPQAHEILRTWAFYTILKSHLHENKLPWKNIMVSGWCLADDKSKMSKSKGNIISPVNLIERYGSDVIRHWAATSKLGADTAFSEDLLKLGKKLVNKLWNASKFVSIHFEKIDDFGTSLEENVKNGRIFHDSDLWIISKLSKTLENASNSLNKFEYADALSHIEEFFWKDFCDNYLEISKTRTYNENGSDSKGSESAILTLYHSLNIILRILAIYIPSVTEEIYTNIFDNNSVHSRGNWPKLSKDLFNQDSINSGDQLVSILNLVRKAKSAKNLSMKSEIETLRINIELSENQISDLKNVTNSKQLEKILDFKGEIFEDDAGYKIIL